jgi:hypothetical protein
MRPAPDRELQVLTGPGTVTAVLTFAISDERGDIGEGPVPYPTACRPQAWAAGVPLAMVPTRLGLQPHLHQGTVSMAPFLPRSVRRLEVRGIPFPTGHLSIAADEDGTRVIHAPAGIAIEVQPTRRLRSVPGGTKGAV